MSTKKSKEEKEISVEITNRELLLHTLEAMACHPTVDEDGTIEFRYQGAYFVAEASEGSPFCWVNYYWISSCKLHEIDKIMRMKKAVNIINSRCVPNMYYDDEDDDDDFGVHCCHRFLFIPEIPSPDIYLQSVLKSFFEAQIAFEVQMEKLEGRA